MLFRAVFVVMLLLLNVRKSGQVDSLSKAAAKVKLVNGEVLVGFVKITRSFSTQVIFSRDITFKESVKYTPNDIESFTLNDSLAYKTITLIPKLSPFNKGEISSPSVKVFVNILLSGKVTLGIVDGSLPSELKQPEKYRKVWYILGNDRQGYRILADKAYKQDLIIYFTGCSEVVANVNGFSDNIEHFSLFDAVKKFNTCGSESGVVYTSSVPNLRSSGRVQKYSLLFRGMYGVIQYTPNNFGLSTSLDFGFGFGGSFESNKVHSKFINRLEIGFQKLPTGWRFDDDSFYLLSGGSNLKRTISTVFISYIPKYIIPESSFYVTSGVNINVFLGTDYKDGDVREFIMSNKTLGFLSIGPAIGLGKTFSLGEHLIGLETRYSINFLPFQDFDLLNSINNNSTQFVYEAYPFSSLQLQLNFSF